MSVNSLHPVPGLWEALSTVPSATPFLSYLCCTACYAHCCSVGGGDLPAMAEAGTGSSDMWVSSGRCLPNPGANCPGKLPRRKVLLPLEMLKRDTFLLKPIGKGHPGHVTRLQSCQ